MKDNLYGINEESYAQMIKVFESIDDLKKVYIFGSRARNDYKEESDIDLAIECDNNVTSRLLSKLNDIRCILTFDVVNINNLQNQKLIDNIKKDGILIYNKN